jgi:hypothetical protein
MRQYWRRWSGLWLILPWGFVGACAGGTGRTVYVERLGNDTLSVEVLDRTADRIAGRLVTRNPVTRVADYNATLSAAGKITRLEVRWTTPTENPEGPEAQQYVVTLEGDSATVERQSGEVVDTARFAIPDGAIPVVGKTPVSVLVWEQAVRRALAQGGDSVPFHLIRPGRPGTTENAIVRRSGDTVKMGFFGSPFLARVDDEGRILGITGRETTVKTETERVSSVDFDRLVSDFAARDARGEGLGVPSPRGEVQATAAGANFTVVYSRPAKRGRKIFGGLIPFDQIWRTGANAATMFTTDRDLVIAGERVPAGSYTLWTTFTADTDTLIINEQTGQWGTEYDRSRDLVRVPLERRALDDPVERFTIAIEPRDGGGELKLTWDTRELTVGMEVRR